MIIYSKHLWGFPLLCRAYGSTLPRAFPFAVFSSVLTWIVEEYANDQTRLWLDHPYPYQMYAWVVGFVLIFRSNFGYQRYWEGRTRIQDMSSKWIDGAAMVRTHLTSVHIREPRQSHTLGTVRGNHRFCVSSTLSPQISSPIWSLVCRCCASTRRQATRRRYKAWTEAKAASSSGTSSSIL